MPAAPPSCWPRRGPLARGVNWDWTWTSGSSTADGSPKTPRNPAPFGTPVARVFAFQIEIVPERLPI